MQMEDISRMSIHLEPDAVTESEELVGCHRQRRVDWLSETAKSRLVVTEIKELVGCHTLRRVDWFILVKPSSRSHPSQSWQEHQEP